MGEVNSTSAATQDYTLIDICETYPVYILSVSDTVEFAQRQDDKDVWGVAPFGPLTIFGQDETPNTKDVTVNHLMTLLDN